MSLHRQAHPSSSLSDTISIGSAPSRCSSTEGARFRNTKTRQVHDHHSSLAPPTFASRSQCDRFTSKSYSSSSSTFASSDDEKATYSPSLTSAIPSTKTKKKAKSRSSTSGNHKIKGERSCLDFDWSYRNVHSSGSSHGRKSIAGGSGSVGVCVLM